MALVGLDAMSKRSPMIRQKINYLLARMNAKFRVDML